MQKEEILQNENLDDNSVPKGELDAVDVLNDSLLAGNIVVFFHMIFITFSSDITVRHVQEKACHNFKK